MWIKKENEIVNLSLTERIYKGNKTSYEGDIFLIHFERSDSDITTFRYSDYKKRDEDFETILSCLEYEDLTRK